MNAQAHASPTAATPPVLHLTRQPRTLQRKCSCGGSVSSGGECEACKKKKKQQGQQQLQRSTASNAESQPASKAGPEDEAKAGSRTAPHAGPQNKSQNETQTAPPIVHDVLNSPGQPLDAKTRAFFEPRFHHDFSKVRIHTDSKAAASAHAVSALAYTVGNDIAFAPGRYAPQTRAGRELLGHELAHVVQQHGFAATKPPASHSAAGSKPNALAIGPSHSPAERQADTAARAALQGADAEGLSRQPMGVARETAPPSPPQTGQQPNGTAPMICGPDVTSALADVVTAAERYYEDLDPDARMYSCRALGSHALLNADVPSTGWDVKQLYQNNTGWLDNAYAKAKCGSPRHKDCGDLDVDKERDACEQAGTCGNTVLVRGRCMLAGTANYAIYGAMVHMCGISDSDYSKSWMLDQIDGWKTIANFAGGVTHLGGLIDGFQYDDGTAAKAMASAYYDDVAPPAAAEDRKSCKERCSIPNEYGFDFLWKPYKV